MRCIAADIESIAARVNRHVQALFNLAQMFVEWSAQIRQQARIGGFQGELKRFSWWSR